MEGWMWDGTRDEAAMKYATLQGFGGVYAISQTVERLLMVGQLQLSALLSMQEREYELENEHRRLMDKDAQIAAAQRAEDVAIVSASPSITLP